MGFITTCKTDLYFNDSLIVNTPYHFRDEYNDPRLKNSGPLYIQAGKKYSVRLEAGETYGVAEVELVWSVPRDDQAGKLMSEAIEIAKKADAVVMCMGLSARLEGEEMDVEIQGFHRGDRTRLDLPDIQQMLIKEIYELGKPVVLVLLSGSAIAVNWEDEYLPAILQLWYPGQAGGQALADVIFGDYNPAGRLPVTFYRSVNDLPPFEQYYLTGQTYQYFEGEPLYPFGFGLSYTTFEYSDLKMKNEHKAGNRVEITVTVQNTGDIDGEEVVQVYVKNLNPPYPSSNIKLKEFKRIKLGAGERKNIKFVLPPDAFSVMNDQNETVILPGSYEISVGGGQPRTVAGTLQETLTLVE
jgi:beta-glucosidase